jgi:hypothetical protein
LRTGGIKRPFVVVVPDTWFTSGADEMSDGDYNKARRDEEVRYTESLQWKFGLDNMSAVFVRPDSSRQPNASWDSRRDIAKFTAHLVGESGPLRDGDAIAVSERLANWVLERANGAESRMTYGNFLDDHANERLRRARTSLARKYRDWTEKELRLVGNAFKGSSTPELLGHRLEKWASIDCWSIS